uniref:Transposase Helix-turn-helix domain-containing protein n=1 Tax=Rhipicephalus microplus TaxID=6941 RepID=A0A6G5A097_RHIMP
MRVLAWSWMSPLMISKVNCCVLLWKKSASTKMQPHHVLPYPRRNFHLCYTVLWGQVLECVFGGFDTVSLTPGAVKDLCGVCDNVFALLLSLLPEVRDKTTDVSLPNKLLIFLFKMKHGLPFSVIAVLFGIHETTASRKWIYKPQMHVIKDACPECFKINYPDCTVIVDCTEVRTETPSEVRQQHVFAIMQASQHM